MKHRDSSLDLIERFVDGRATREEVTQLEQRLRDDPKVRAMLLQYANLDSALAASCALVAAPATKRHVGWFETCWSAVSSWRLAAAGAAAVVTLMAAVFWLYPPRPDIPPSVPVVLEILHVDGASGFLAGERQTLTNLSIESGAVSFRLDSGVVVETLGPAQLVFRSPMEFHLVQGRVTVEVSPQATGFAVRTSTARVVDLGTRFGVAVTGSRRTEVAVWDGRVDVFEVHRRKTRTNAIASLTQGEGVAVDGSGRPSRLTSALLNSEGTGWGTFRAGTVIQSITDNVGDEAFYGFYGILPGGLREGAPVYSDRKRIRWHATGSAGWPQELVGLDLVCPPNTDRHQRQLELEVKLSAPGTVYVMLDRRRVPPAWLKRDFQKTAWRLRSGPWSESPVVRGLQANAAGEFFIEYDVWSRVIRKAGEVALGPPHLPGEGGAKSMFGVAVKPRTASHHASHSSSP